MVSKRSKRRKRRISFLMSLVFLTSLFFCTPMINLATVEASTTAPDITPSATLGTDQIDKGNTVNLSYAVTPIGNLTSQKKPVDIVLVIDDSGSMGGSSKMGKAKTAAKDFIESFAASSAGLSNRVGLVAFDTYAYKASELKNINNKDEKKYLENQVDKIYAEGNTNLHEAIKVARNILGPKDATRSKCIIVLTDGEPNYYVTPWNGNYVTAGSYWDTKGGYGNWGLPWNCTEYYSEYYGEANALAEIADAYNNDGTKTYAIGVATNKNSVDSSFIAKMADNYHGHGMGKFTSKPEDINGYYQEFLKDITQKGSISQIKITQTIPNGLEVDMSSLSSGWSYNPNTRILSGTINDIPFKSDLGTPSKITIPVILKATNEGIYNNCKATISYIDISGKSQTKDFYWGNFKVVNPVTTTADISASGSVSDTSIERYSKVNFNYTITPKGSVVVKTGSKGSSTIKGISFKQSIPDGLIVDTLPTGWSYDANTRQLSGSFNNVQFAAGQSAPSAVTKIVTLIASKDGTISIPDASLTYTKELNTNGIISNDAGAATFKFGSISVSGRKLSVLYVHGRNQAAEISSNNDMDVTEMTIESFISHTLMDINGNYDLIYFGKGNYISATNPANTTETLSASQKISPYDITNRMAGSVKEFINSNQLVVFNNAVFNDSASNFTTNFRSMSPTVLVTDPITNSTVTRQRLYFVNSETNNSLLQKYVALGLHRPSINVTSAPLSYSVNPSGTNNKTLSFTFTPKSTDNRALTANLYLDKNGDGKFGYKDDTGKDLELVATKSVANGTQQSLSYTLKAKTLTQLLYWKLEIVDDRGQKVEKVDSLLFKDQPVKMNVLQIMPNNGNGGASNAGSYGNLKTLFEKTVDKHKLGYIDGVMDINVTPMVADDFDKPEVYNNLNGKYDMIIVGFDDCYQKDIRFSDPAIAAINKFIKTGQGVMFSHDTIWGSGNTEIKDAFIKSVGQKDQSTRYCNNGGLDYNGSLAGIEAGGYDMSDIAREKVKKVNDSAITNFPYGLPDVLEVATTHVQYYRLDLENVDPWYNMYDDYAGGKHVIDNDDSVDSYYTYSIGNVTFSGTGHITETFKDKTDELKLFANTIIRAYTGANHAPVLNVSKPVKDQKVALSDDKIHVEFSASDFDVYDQGTNALTARVYIKDLDKDGKDKGSYTQLNQVYVDTNKDGIIDKLTGGDVKFTSDDNVKIAIPKNFSNAKRFEIKVEVTDTKGAQDNAEISMKACDAPELQVNSSIDKAGCLIGDSVKFTTIFEAKGSEDDGNISNINLNGTINSKSVVVDDKGYFTVTPNATGKTIAMKAGVLDEINYSPKPDPESKTVEYSAKFDTAGTYSISNNYSYKADGKDSGIKSLPGVNVEVKDGKITVNVKDKNHNGIANVKVKVTQGSTFSKTGTSGTNGVAVISNVPTGSYTVSLETVSADYVKPADQSSELKYSAVNTTAYEKTIDFTLEDAAPHVDNYSISTISGGNKLSAKKNEDTQIVIKFRVDKPIKKAVINLDSTGNIGFDVKGVTCSGTSASYSGKNIILTSTSPSGNLSEGNYTVVVTINGVNNSSAAYGSGSIKLVDIKCNKNSKDYPTICNKTIDAVIYNGIKLG